MNIDYDKLFDKLNWSDSGVQSLKGQWGPYKAKLSWVWPSKQATITVYRYDVLVYGAQDAEVSKLYNNVWNSIQERYQGNVKTYEKAFLDTFGKD